MGEAEYRIRWGRVIGPWDGKRRMCIAERRYHLFWLIPFWFPIDANWRNTHAEALRDIKDDIQLRAPLPAPHMVEVIQSSDEPPAGEPFQGSPGYQLDRRPRR